MVVKRGEENVLLWRWVLKERGCCGVFVILRDGLVWSSTTTYCNSGQEGRQGDEGREKRGGGSLLHFKKITSILLLGRNTCSLLCVLMNSLFISYPSQSWTCSHNKKKWKYLDHPHVSGITPCFAFPLGHALLLAQKWDIHPLEKKKNKHEYPLSKNKNTKKKCLILSELQKKARDSASIIIMPTSATCFQCPLCVHIHLQEYCLMHGSHGTCDEKWNSGVLDKSCQIQLTWLQEHTAHTDTWHPVWNGGY